MFDFQKFPYYVFILSRLFFHEAIHLLLNLSASLSLLEVSLAEMPLLLLLLVLIRVVLLSHSLEEEEEEEAHYKMWLCL